ncbi:hypothetical protein ACTFIZ_008745 [Dictyostelium cf. discoideum]
MLQVDIYEINGYSLMCKKEVWKGFSESMHKYFHIMKDLAEESNVEPFRRIETFSNFVNRFNNNQQYLKSWRNGVSTLKVNGLVYKHKNVPINNATSLRNVQIESQLPNPVVHHPVLSRNFCDIRSNIYTDILDEYTKKRTAFFLIIIPQNNAEVYKGIKIKSFFQLKILTQCIFSRIFDKGRSVSIKLKHHIIDKLGLASWGLSQDIYKANPPSTLIELKITHQNLRLRTKCNIDIFRTKDYSYGSYSSNPVSKWYL